MNITWKNFKIDDHFYVIGRGDVFVVDNKNFYNVQVNHSIKVDGQKYIITGIERIGKSAIIGLICKKINHDSNFK